MGKKNQIRKAQKVAKKNPKRKSLPFDLYFLLLSTIIIIPLIFSLKTLDPDLGPRMLALGIVIFIISMFYFVRLQQHRPNFGFVNLLIFPVSLLYFLVSIFSMTQAINSTEGLFDIVKTFLTFGLLVYSTQLFITNKNYFIILAKMVIVSSVVATSIGIYQYFVNIPGNTGPELLKILYNVKGLMAHKNQFVISMFLMLPFTIYGISKFSKFWFTLSILQTLMILLNIVILQTRSVWVATVVSVFIFIALWLIFTLKNRGVSKFISLKQGLFLGVIIMIVVSGSAIVFKKTGTVPLLKHKVSSLFDSKSHDNQGRLKMWESTWEMVQDNMFFGVGAGNWKISVLPYYNANFGANYQNWRRPHNDFLWVLSEKGILGFILYLMIFVIIAYYGIKVVLRESDKDVFILAALIISGIGGYFVIAMFTFPLERINHQIYLTIMISVIISIYCKGSNIFANSNKLYKGLLGGMIVLSIGSVYYSGIMIKSEINGQKLVAAKKSGEWKKVIKYADKAISPIITIDSYSMPIHLHRGVANVKLNHREEAFEDFKIALNNFPTQIAVLNNLAIVSAEMNNLDNAIMYFKQALEIFPNYEISSFNLVKAYYKNKEYEEGYIALLNCSADITKPDYSRIKIDLEKKLNKKSR